MVFMIALSTILLLVASTVNDPHPSALVGQYDGHRMEMAAGLSLTADGHFQYGLSYGALDEEAEGTWYFDGAYVVLNSKPVTAPHFTFLGQAAAVKGSIHIDLQVPAGMDPQYFNATIVMADGTTADGQLSADGLSLSLAGGRSPRSAQIMLPMFDIASDPVAVDPKNGLKLMFRFEPNDIGHAGFNGTRLERENGDLILTRYGAEIHFHPVEK
jgi:hypothetical protein